MLQINCPLEEKSSTHCKWVLISGSVRDQPDVGLLQCSDCHLVTHSKDLSQDVNYESGTMHDWASGYSDSLAPPVEDINRRLEALRAMPNAGSKKLLDFGCGFGKDVEISKISLHTLNQNGSWIYLPASIEVSFIPYVDTTIITRHPPIETITQKITDENNVQIIKLTELKTCRYIRLVAKNYGIIPSGKPGAGNTAWLFVDEIEVE